MKIFIPACRKGSRLLKRTLMSSKHFFTCLVLIIAFLLAGIPAWAADPPDTLALVDGETLIGQFVQSKDGAVMFHSDVAGDVVIPWAKIKSLTTSRRFAVIPNGLRLKEHQTDGKIPRGTITVSDQKIQIVPGGNQPEVAATTTGTAFIVTEEAYQKALRPTSLTEDWKGAVTGGVSIIQATQDSTTLTGAVRLVRAIPDEDWLTAENKTLVNFTGSYGKVNQPNTPTVKTNLLHFDGERDEYFSARVYGLGQIALDHNFSEGLTLQQTYGGGVGWSVLKSDIQALDLKTTASYISQRFNGSPSQNLIGSVFGETYHRNLRAGIKFDEELTAVPAWNNASAFTANGGAGITMALHKRLSFNVSTLDTFLDDPPPGFKKNSFQFTTGLTYSLQ
jgi:hypothetical protein